jgi:hypothetical protein
MRVFLRLIFCVCLADTLLGQTFNPVPGPLLEQELALNQANECYIYFQNPSGDTLRLHWRQLEFSLPQGWDTDLCDYGSCYIGVPPNGLMSQIFGTTQAYLKLIVQPGTLEGAAWIWFRVYEEGHADNYRDVYYSLHTSGVTGVNTPSAASIQAFPNPANESLTIVNETNGSFDGRLISTTGHVLWRGRIHPGSTELLDTHLFPAGIYVLQGSNEVRKICINR